MQLCILTLVFQTDLCKTEERTHRGETDGAIRKELWESAETPNPAREIWGNTIKAQINLALAKMLRKQRVF